MKRLAQSTIEKHFEKIGFEPNLLGMYLMNDQMSLGGRISMKFTSQIELHDARWVCRGNVHIVSYWHWPSNLIELKTISDDIKSVYSELCGSRFK